MVDWLPALDTLLREDIRCCTACGVRDRRGWLDVVSLGERGFTVLRCRACYADEQASRAVVETVLQQRYGHDPVTWNA